jgi:preprotein translocase subunit Sss1
LIETLKQGDEKMKSEKEHGYTIFELLFAIFGIGIIGLIIYVVYLLIAALQKYIGG